jgi:hypothetical protein
VNGNLISVCAICKGLSGAERPVLTRASPRAHLIFTMILKRDRPATHQQNPSAIAIHNICHNTRYPSSSQKVSVSKDLKDPMKCVPVFKITAEFFYCLVFQIHSFIHSFISNLSDTRQVHSLFQNDSST